MNTPLRRALADPSLALCPDGRNCTLYTGAAPRHAVRLHQQGRTYEQAVRVIGTLADAYGLEYQIMPFDQADDDVKRALGADFCPLVSQTTETRWVTYEQYSLRIFAEAIETAVFMVDDIEPASEAGEYDTRCGEALQQIAIGFTVMHIEPDPTDYRGRYLGGERYAVVLSAGPDRARKLNAMLDDPVNGRPNDGRRTWDEHMAKAAPVFAESRAQYARDNA